VRRLLIRPGAIGDIITSLPAIESLRAEYTEVWAPTPVVPLLHHLGEVHAIASTGLDLLELGLAPAALRARLARFDSIVSWYGANRTEFRDAVQGLPFVFFPALPGGACHATDFYNSQARTLGVEPAGIPRLPLPRQDLGFAVIHPFSSNPAKNWPLKDFEAVAAHLCGRLPVHWLAGPEESLEGAVRISGLGDLAHWLAQARLYVGNDTGITHLAAAVGVPTAAIFQSTDPAVWAPRGAVPLVRPAREEVLSAVDGLLAQGA
jgi:ADP-heptose:LPS heptosyltransferase